MSALRSVPIQAEAGGSRVSVFSYNRWTTGDTRGIQRSKMDAYSFGEWMHKRREQLRLTQRELAAMVHCSMAMIKKIEGDARHPSPELAELLAIALEIPHHTQELFIEIARGVRRIDVLWLL